MHIEVVAAHGRRYADAGERRAGVIVGLAEARSVEIGLDAEHRRAGLEVVAGLAAADEAAIAASKTARVVSRKERVRSGGIQRRRPATAAPMLLALTPT